MKALFTLRRFAAALALLLWSHTVACSGDGSSDFSGSGATTTSTSPGGAGTGTGAAGASTTSGTGATGAGGTSGGGTTSGGAPVVTECADKVYECGDGLDNDGDGAVDSADPDCHGVCDNSESTLSFAPTCEKAAPCLLDCYFDHDCGSGNDDCHFIHTCDPNEVPPNYWPYGPYCEYDPNISLSGQTCDDLLAAQSPICHQTCDALVPNGCDCFGCCELVPGSGDHVFIDSYDFEADVYTCTLADAADPTKCHPCQYVPSCFNPCDACEICIGKTALPGECAVQACPPGAAACGLPGQAACPAGSYCVTGCCQPTPTP